MSLAVPDVLLIQIASLANNAHFPQVCRATHKLWKSEPCKNIRFKLYKDKFFELVNLKQEDLPPYLFSRLTEPLILSLGPYLIPSTRSNISLNLIQEAEKAKDWVAGYFFAHLYPTHTLWMTDITEHFPLRREKCSFSTWMILLQNPKFADQFIKTFQLELPQLKLDLASKTLCAASIVHNYRRTATHPDSDSYTLLIYLQILTQLTVTCEGRRAILDAKAETLLREIAALPDSVRAYRDSMRDQARYALENLGYETPISGHLTLSSMAIRYLVSLDRGTASPRAAPSEEFESKQPPPPTPAPTLRKKRSLCRIH